nr:MAG TPA: hypothetical protein [Caudoviricetes sp.]
MITLFVYKMRKCEVRNGVVPRKVLLIRSIFSIFKAKYIKDRSLQMGSITCVMHASNRSSEEELSSSSHFR